MFNTQGKKYGFQECIQDKIKHLWYKPLAKMEHDEKLLTIFAKYSIIDFLKGPKYARDHSFSAFTKFSEKPTFLNP